MSEARIDRLESRFDAIDDRLRRIEHIITRIDSIHVNGPWCITFEWQDGKALRVDLEQYH
jgi:plasmid maintenance system killer protein